jgi:hypothetical protein
MKADIRQNFLMSPFMYFCMGFNSANVGNLQLTTFLITVNDYLKLPRELCICVSYYTIKMEKLRTSLNKTGVSHCLKPKAIPLESGLLKVEMLSIYIHSFIHQWL